MNRQKVLLGILAVLLLVVAWIYLVPSGDTAPPPSMSRAAGRAADGEVGLAAAPRSLPGAGAVAAAAKDTAQTVLPLRLAALDGVPRSFTAGRDPWRFVEPPPPPPPVPRKPSAAELRAMLTKIECNDVQTYVQSGNAVFGTKLSEAALTKAIEHALEAYMGRPIATTRPYRSSVSKRSRPA